MKSLFLGLLIASVSLSQVGGLQNLPTWESRTDVATNGSFETDTDWTLTNTTRSSADARTGTWSISFTGDTKGTIQQQINSVAGRAYRIQFYYKTAGTVPGNAYVHALFSCQTDNGFAIHSGHQYNEPLGNASTWTLFSHDLLTWGDEHFGHNVYVKIHPDKLGAATVYIDDVVVEPRIVPLTVFPINPAYRGILWTDQSQTMTWKAIVEVPEGKSGPNLEAWVEVLDSGLSVIDTVKTTSLAAVNTTGGKGAQWPGVSLNDQQYDMTAQGNGIYYLRPKLVEKPSTVLYTGPDFKIIKEAPATQRGAWNAYVDQHSRVVLNGKPTFLWGTFLNPNFGCNGGSGPYATPEGYLALGAGPNNSVPQFTWWDKSPPGTLLRMLAAAGMNTDIFFGNLAGANIGVVNNSGLTGTLSSTGTAVTGSGTVFLSQLSPGDTINVSGLSGTGTVSSYARRVEGSGTVFTAECEIGDRISIGGAERSVAQIDSDTVLWTGSGNLDASGSSFSINAYREVTAVTDDTTLTVDSAFPVNLSGATATRNLCTGYNPAYSQLLPWLDAAQVYGVRHWQIAAQMTPRDANYPNWALICRKQTATQAIRFLFEKEQTTGRRLGSERGWLGLYTADEPPPQSPTEGVAVSYEKSRATWDAVDPSTGKSFGGVNYWVDGLMPVQTWNQWNSFVDTTGSDPYPVGFGETADDVAFDVRKTNGRIHGRSYWWTRRLSNWVFDARPNITTIQMFRVTVPAGLPTDADRQIQIVGSIAAGATGILEWEAAGGTAMGCLANDNYYREYQETSAALKGVLPILSEPIDDLAERMDGGSDYGVHISSVSDSDVKCSSRNRGSEILLACTNTLDADQTGVEVALANLTTGRAVNVFGGASTAITNSVIGGSGVGVTFEALHDLTAPKDAVRMWLIETAPAASRTRAAQ